MKGYFKYGKYTLLSFTNKKSEPDNMYVAYTKINKHRTQIMSKITIAKLSNYIF